MLKDYSSSLPASGLAIHARRNHADPRLLFLHGFAGDLHTWDALWTAAGDRLPPALRYDQRGFGATPEAEEDFDHAADLLALMDAAGIVQADLVGVSQGGAIALNFALDHPQRVRRLALISPGMVAWDWSEDWRRLWRPIVVQARAGNMEAARELWWQHPLFASTRASPAAAALQASIRRYSGREWIRDRQVQKLPDIERLHRLQIPTLLLTGAKDMADFRLIADVIEQGAGDRVRRIDDADCGHLLHLEAPQRCAQRLLDFFAEAP